MRSDFDKSYRRTKGVVIGIWVFTIVAMVAVLTVAIWGGIKIANRIERDGLKSIIEEVWEGEDGK